MDNDFLQVNNICFAYGEKNVLENINIKISKGEKIVFMGKNGAGKSTLFLILNGVLKPQKGSVSINGTEVKRNILPQKTGIVFQDSERQIIAPTVYKEVMFGPLNMGMDKEKAHNNTKKAMEDMEVWDFKDKPPHYLSGGERKRVCIADIAAMETDIMIFDEPTSFLDSSGSEKMFNILESFHKKGKTVIVSTHDENFAYKWADRIIVIKNGKVAADEKTADFFKNKKLLEETGINMPDCIKMWSCLKETGFITGDSMPKDTEELIDIIKKERK